MTEDARPEDTGPQREMDALFGLPDDIRVNLDDIEWPDLEWLDADRASTPPAADAGPAAPLGPKFNGKDGGDWRPAVPFWLQAPGPTPILPQQATEAASPEPRVDDPRDWRPAVPFWLRTSEPTAGQAERPEPEAEAQPAAITPPEPEPPMAAEPEPPTQPETEPAIEEELPPEEDLTPLPGTTGEAIFFPPSSPRTFVATAADAPVPDPQNHPSSPSEPSPVPATRASVERTPETAYSAPVAPYAQYDSSDAGWARDQIRVAPAAAESSSPFERRAPAPRSERGKAHARRRWLVRGGLVGSAIGILIVALVVVLATQGRFSGAAQTATGTPTGNPEDAVSSYLNALAHSDAQQALSFAKLPPTDQRMLTDEVLAASNASAPLRRIEVRTTELTDYRAQVEAGYALGEQQVTESFTVYAVGTEWKLYDVTRKVELGRLGTGDLPLRVNGVTITADSVELFPGRYEVSAADERYRLTNAGFVIGSPAVGPDLGAAKVELSGAGVKQIVAAATRGLNRCLAVRELQPAGCGFGAVVPKGTVVRSDTVRWKVTKGRETLTTLRPVLDANNPRLATAAVQIRVTGTAKDTKGGELGVADSITTVIAALGADGIEITFD